MASGKVDHARCLVPAASRAVRVAGATMALTALAGAAQAADWTSGYGSGSGAQPAGSIIAIDTSVTATTSNSIFANTSVTAALTGDLEQVSGWRARVEGQVGSFEYRSDDTKIIGNQQSGSALVGYEWAEPDVHVAAYIGFNYQNIKLDPVDPSNGTRGHGYGLRVVGELYANPTPYTMVSAYGSYSTHANAYYTRFKAGYALYDRTFIGPEFSMLGDNFYKQWRVGAHISGLTFGRFQFGLSGGYVRDSRRGPGGYVLVDSRVTF
ncbi:cellulose biosynthesis protein BcsS [Camelimonas sp. ID_303_24]